MSLGDAIPLALAISGLVVYLAVIWRYVTRPDREPVPHTQLFQDTWHVPTLVVLIAGLIPILATFGLGWYVLTQEHREALLAGFLAVVGVAAAVQVVGARAPFTQSLPVPRPQRLVSIAQVLIVGPILLLVLLLLSVYVSVLERAEPVLAGFLAVVGVALAPQVFASRVALSKVRGRSRRQARQRRPIQSTGGIAHYQSASG